MEEKFKILQFIEKRKKGEEEEKISSFRLSFFRNNKVRDKPKASTTSRERWQVSAEVVKLTEPNLLGKLQLDHPPIDRAIQDTHANC